MKSPTSSFIAARKSLFAAFSALSTLGSGYISAAEIVKADNSTALDQASSWVGGTAPTATDIAVFNSTLTTGLTVGFAGNVAYKGIKVQNNPSNITINGLTSQTLTLGSSGLDLSGAASGTFFDIDSPTVVLAPASGQTWTVGSGVNSTIWAPLTATGASFTLDLSPLNSGAFFAEGFGTPGAILPRAFVKTATDYNFATLNTGDRKLIAADATLSTANPSDGGTATAPANLTAAPAAGTYLDVVNSNGLATATAFRAYAGTNPDNSIGAGTFWTDAGLRFNQPHATAATDWIVDVSAKIMYSNPGTFSILVTPGVGARNVIFAGGANGNAFRYNGTNANILVHQANTQGDLILRASVSSTGGNNTHFTKTGPGRLIMGNGSYGASATSNIYIGGGTVQLGENNATGTFGDLPIINNGTLRVQRSDAFFLGSLISGSGNLSVAMGSGSLTLTGANTFTGSTTLESGSLTLGTASALGTPSAIDLQSGSLIYGAGVTTDLSAAPITIGGNVTLDIGANNVTYANSIGGGGAGGLTKAGSGTLTLASGNTYGGNTTVSAGGLTVTNVSGSATGVGSVSLSSGAVLAGSGSIAGAVTVPTGAKVVPGVGTGTLTTGGLSLAAGSLLDFEFSSLSSYDKVVVTNSNGLTINGGAIHLYNSGTTDTWATAGTYNLFQYSGNIQGTGVSALSVLNPQAGYSYTFGTSGGNVTLQIVLDAILSKWNLTSGGSWASSSNWTNGVPSTNYTAQFTTSLAAPSTVTLDGDRTVNGLVFDSASGYTIASGTGGTLTFFKSGSSAAINATSGSHVVSAPSKFDSSVAATVDVGATLTLSGVVSGVGGLSKAGSGVLDLTAHNTFSGSVSVVGGTLGFAYADGLGSGSLTLSGGALRYDTGNTADISGKVVTFGLDGATVNTNGNNVTFANSVGNAGSGAFTKSGAGTLTLSAANSYDGATSITGGELAIASNAALGTPSLGRTLTLNGGQLVPSVTMALDNAGANVRSIAVGSNGGGFRTPSGVTLTVNGGVSGSGTFTKAGPGNLVLTANNTTTNIFTGPVQIGEGDVSLGANRAILQTGLGSGAITFTGTSSLHLNGAGQPDSPATTFGVMSNAIVVPSGVVADIYSPIRGGYSGVVSGQATTVGGVTTYPSGTLHVHVDGNRFDVNGVWPNFYGTYIISKTPTGDGSDTDQYRMVFATSNVGHNLINAKVHVDAGVEMYQTFNPPNGGTTASTTTHHFGELTADAGAILGGNPVAGRFNAYSVGALNTDFTINGQFRGSLGTFGYGYPVLTKVGTGKLTLNGNHMMVSPTNVNGGTLDIRGSIERFYLGIGADGVYGRLGTGTCDDTISLTPPTTAYQEVHPGVFTVAAAATLAGNGRLGGAVTVNGTLRPSATGDLGGQLSFTNLGTLVLAATATTQFDFGGTIFTGVKCDAASGVTYGGALKLNFLGSAYNGPYTLFQLNGAPNGSFASVSVKTAASAETALTDTGGGVWSGTVNGATFSFNASTGVLTVSGGATAVTPGTPTGVTATAGNTQVSLGWNAAANADSYIVKRGTVAGGPYTTVSSSVVTTSYVDTGLTNGTTYYYVIQAKNASGLTSGNSAEVSATPTAVVLTGLQTWRQEHFGTTDNTGNAADSADPDSDGIPNLLEYATGRDPMAASTPVLTLGSSAGSLTVTYTRIADTSLTYTVQGVNDVGGTPTWATVATSTGAANVAGPVTVTDTQTIASSPRRFLRLTVSYTP